MPSRSFAVAPLLGLALLGACSVQPSVEDVDESEGAASSRSRVTLAYEGTCDFLRTCSRFSRGLPQGQVTWGCTGRGACSDADLWVAAPTRSSCGKTVRICRGTRCTNALVKDVSSAREWEASNGVFDALGLPHGLHGQCSGYGSGQVTVEVQSGSSSSSGNPSDPTLVPEPGSSSSGGSSSGGSSGGSSSGGSSSGDDGVPAKGSSSGSGGTKDPAPPSSADDCILANGDAVRDLGCVYGADGSWYQCSRGQWYRGGNGSEGVWGQCSEIYQP